MVDETEKEELERIKAKYQNNLGTDYSSSHDYQSLAHAKSLVLDLRQYLKLTSQDHDENRPQNSPFPKLTILKTHPNQNSPDPKLDQFQIDPLPN